MSDEQSPTELDRDPPESPPTMAEALEQVGHETRAHIVLELGAYSDGPTDTDGLGYAELMERVGADDSGRFNYHLDKLVGVLVTKAEDGYWLRTNGHFLYQALVAGTLTADAGVPSFETERTCTECGGPVRAAYAVDQIFFARCEDCHRVYHHLEFPARGVRDRSGAEALTAAVRYANGRLADMRRGVCPACAGRVETDLLIADDAGELADLAPDEESFAALDCQSCSLERTVSPDVAALTTPPVVGFFADRGIDPYEVGVPDVDEYVERVRVDDERPVSATVTFEIDGETLAVTLDESLSVVETA